MNVSVLKMFFQQCVFWLPRPVTIEMECLGASETEINEGLKERQLFTRLYINEQNCLI